MHLFISRIIIGDLCGAELRARPVVFGAVCSCSLALGGGGGGLFDLLISLAEDCGDVYD